MASSSPTKRCVWDGGPLLSKTVTRWQCGTCGLSYAIDLIGDKAAWKEFRRRARAAIAAEQLKHPNEDLRPMIGVTLASVLEGMGEWTP